MTATTSTVALRAAQRRDGAPGSTGWTAGSVTRWRASQKPPTAPRVIPVRKPTGGATSVASRVTSGGPTTNTTSSTTASRAKAVCRRSGSASASAHRARTSEPMLGPLAPHSAASTNQVHSGAPAVTAATKATPETR